MNTMIYGGKFSFGIIMYSILTYAVHNDIIPKIIIYKKEIKDDNT